MGDGAPTAPVSPHPLEPTENRQVNPQQQRSERVRGVVLPGPVEGPAAAVMNESERGDAVSVLVRRGVDRSVAEELVAEHGVEAVHRAAHLYDERRRSPKPPHGPGWLVAALRRGFSGESKSRGALLTHREMLDWCEANGGLTRTAEFETVTVEEGGVLFRRKVG